MTVLTDDLILNLNQSAYKPPAVRFHTQKPDWTVANKMTGNPQG